MKMANIAASMGNVSLEYGFVTQRMIAKTPMMNKIVKVS